MARHRETRTEHYFQSYGQVVKGYGSSMDPHHCGDPNEPCVTITQEREVTDWETVSRVRRG